MAAYGAYAEYADVLARAGRAKIAAGQAGAPEQGEVEGFLRDVAGLLNTAIGTQGVTVPVTDADAIAALRGINADGALVLWLSAAFPSGGQDQAVADLKKSAEDRFRTAMAGLLAGSHAVVKLLVTREVDIGTQASNSLWQQEPQYDLTARWEEMSLGASIRPRFHRGQTL